MTKPELIRESQRWLDIISERELSAEQKEQIARDTSTTSTSITTAATSSTGSR
jgi:hypothetical protein